MKDEEIKNMELILYTGCNKSISREKWLYKIVMNPRKEQMKDEENLRWFIKGYLLLDTI